MLSRSGVRLAIVGITALWLALLIVTTRLAAIPGGGVNSWFTAPVYLFGRVICHQRPERSFALWNTQMPVCARCAGVYAGAFLAALLLNAGIPRRPLSSNAARRVLGVAALPTVITLAYEWTTRSMPSNEWRAAAGVPLGLAITMSVGMLLLAPSTSAVQSSYTSVP